MGEGRASLSEFGTLYSTNITPGPDTGASTWSWEAFHRIMRQGVSRNRADHFPVTPYTHFIKISGEDLDTIYTVTRTHEQPVLKGRFTTTEHPFSTELVEMMALLIRPECFT